MEICNLDTKVDICVSLPLENRYDIVVLGAQWRAWLIFTSFSQKNRNKCQTSYEAKQMQIYLLFLTPSKISLPFEHSNGRQN